MDMVDYGCLDLTTFMLTFLFVHIDPRHPSTITSEIFALDLVKIQDDEILPGWEDRNQEDCNFFDNFIP